MKRVFSYLIFFCLFSCATFAYADVDVLVRMKDGTGGRRAGDIIALLGVPNKGFGIGPQLPNYSVVRVEGVNLEDIKPYHKRHFNYDPEDPDKTVRSKYRINTVLLSLADRDALNSSALKFNLGELVSHLADRTTALELSDSNRISRWIQWKQTLKRWANYLPPYRAFATTTYTKVVDPDNYGGTDYLSLGSWEDNFGGTTSGDLVGDDEIAVAQCRASSGTDDTAAVDINGWTTGSNNYILIEMHSDETSTGIWNDSNYVLHNNDSNAIMIDVNEDYVRIDGIQIKVTQTGGNTRVGITTKLVGAGDQRLSNLIIKGVCSGTGIARGLNCNDSNLLLTIYNCIVYDFISGADADFSGIFMSAKDVVGVYNCLVHNCYNGIVEDGVGSLVGKNNIVFGCTDDFTGTPTLDYNASDDGDGTNAISPSGGDWANELTNYAADDFATATTTGNIYQAGVNDPSGSSYGDPDIKGDSRPTAPTGWTVGVAEPSAAGTVFMHPIRRFLGDGYKL